MTPESEKAESALKRAIALLTGTVVVLVILVCFLGVGLLHANRENQERIADNRARIHDIVTSVVFGCEQRNSLRVSYLSIIDAFVVNADENNAAVQQSPFASVEDKASAARADLEARQLRNVAIEKLRGEDCSAVRR